MTQNFHLTVISPNLLVRKLGEISLFDASSVPLILKVASEVRNYLPSKKNSMEKEKTDVRTLLSMLKDSLSLSGKVNQTKNQFP